MAGYKSSKTTRKVVAAGVHENNHGCRVWLDVKVNSLLFLFEEPWYFVTRQLEMPKTKTFELMSLHVSNGTQSVRLLVVYRSPPNTKNGFTTSEFLVEFADLMDTVGMDMSNMLIAGDFNLYMDNESNNDTKHFVDILKAADLTQQVEDPIHAAGHTIDLLITRSFCEFLKNIKIDIPLMSDHSAIHYTLQLAKPPHIRSRLAQ